LTARTSYAASRATYTRPTIVLASVANGLNKFIARLGEDSEAIMAYGGLRSDVATKPNSPIYLGQYCSVMSEAARRTGKSNFGLWFGHQFTPRNNGLFGYLASSSATLREAFANMTEYLAYHQGNSALVLEMRGSRCAVKYSVFDPSIQDQRNDSELSIGMCLNICREALGPAWTPVEVKFAHHKPLVTSEHHDVFGAKVSFDQPFNELVLRTEELATPMPFHDPLLLNVIKQSLQELNNSDILPPLRLSDRAKLEIDKLLSYGYPRLEEVAKRLDMPSWTFQRRLLDEGSTFRDLVEAIRVRTAPNHLADPDVSVSEVAFRLGYSEVSAFSRAFTRWYKVSPKRWRDGLRLTDDVGDADHGRRVLASNR